MLSHEHEQRRRLEEMVEQLARQHSHLEQAAQQQARSAVTSGHSIHSEEDDENEFFDAEEDDAKAATATAASADYIVQVPIGHRRTPSAVSAASQVFIFGGEQATRKREIATDSHL